MKITERVHLVGSGQMGFNLTDPIDCHVYLLNGGSEYALIDAGGGVEPERIVARIEEDGLDPAKVRHLLLTHAHADHAGGTAWLRERFELLVAGSAETAAWVTAGDQEKISLGAAKRAGVYPDDYVFRACPVETALADGDRYRVGEIEVTAVATPGHAAGMLSFVFEEDGARSAFTGDTIFAAGRILLQDIWDCSVQQSCRSIERLAALELEGLYPGHLAFAVTRGHDHVEAAMANIRQLLPPAQMT